MVPCSLNGTFKTHCQVNKLPNQFECSIRLQIWRLKPVHTERIIKIRMYLNFCKWFNCEYARDNLFYDCLDDCQEELGSCSCRCTATIYLCPLLWNFLVTISPLPMLLTFLLRFFLFFPPFLHLDFPVKHMSHVPRFLCLQVEWTQL